MLKQTPVDVRNLVGGLDALLSIDQQDASGRTGNQDDQQKLGKHFFDAPFCYGAGGAIPKLSHQTECATIPTACQPLPVTGTLIVVPASTESGSRITSRFKSYNSRHRSADFNNRFAISDNDSPGFTVYLA